jgi:hypothetical protein
VAPSTHTTAAAVASIGFPKWSIKSRCNLVVVAGMINSITYATSLSDQVDKLDDNNSMDTEASPPQPRIYFVRGAAIASALAFGAGYVWWAQGNADARLAQQVDQAVLTQAEQTTADGNLESQEIMHQEFRVVPEALISGSKSAQTISIGERVPVPTSGQVPLNLKAGGINTNMDYDEVLNELTKSNAGQAGE